MIWLSVFSEDTEQVPPWVTPSDDHLVTVKVGLVEPRSLIAYLGANDEQVIFAKNIFGRKSTEEWRTFFKDISENGNLEPVLIIKDSKGTRLHEGNHRVRACLIARRPVLTELRIYGR